MDIVVAAVSFEISSGGLVIGIWSAFSRICRNLHSQVPHVILLKN